MQKWEYLFINCGLSNHNFVPHFINTQEIPNWQAGPNMVDVSNQLGEQGWELVCLDFGVNANYLAVFKRPKPQQ